MVLFSRPIFYSFLVLITCLIMLSIPNNSELGSLYFDSFQYEKAFTVLSKNSNPGSKDIKSLKKIKEYFLVKGDTLKALDVQRRLVELRPKNMIFLHDLEELYDWNQMPIEMLKTKERRARLIEADKERITLLFEVASGFQWLRNFEHSNRIFHEIFNSEYLSQDQRNGIIEFMLASKQTEIVIDVLTSVNASKEYPKEVIMELLAAAYDIEGKSKKSLVIYMELVYGSKLPDNFDPYTNKDWIKINNEESFFGKLEFFENIIQILKDENRGGLIIEILEKVDSQISYKASFKLRIAERLWEINEKERALVYYRQLKVVKTSREFYLWKISEILLDLDLHEEVEPLLEELIKYNPNAILYVENLANTYEELGKNEKALKMYKKLYKLQKLKLSVEVNFLINNSVLVSQASNIRSDMGAAIAGNKVKKINFTIFKKLKDIEFKIIELLGKLGRYEETIPYYQALLEKFPLDVEANKGLGYIYMSLGDSESAASLFEKVHSLVKTDEDAGEFLASFYVDKKEYEKALTFLNSYENKTIYSSVLREEIYYSTKNPLHKSLCNEVLRRNSEEIDYYELILRCHERDENFKDSLEVSQKRVTKSPNNKSFWEYHIYLLSKNRMYDEALEILNRFKIEKNYNAYNKDQERDILLEKELDKQRYSWLVEYELKKYGTTNFGYLQNEFLLGRKHGKYSFLIGANLIDHKKSGIDKVEEIKFEGRYEFDKSELRLKLGSISKFENNLNFEVRYSIFENNYYYSISLSKDNLYNTNKLANEAKGTVFTGFNSYLELKHHKNKLENSISLKNVELFNNEVGKIFEFDNFYWIPILKRKTPALSISPYLGYTKTSTDYSFFKSIFIEESQRYGAYIKKSFHRPYILFPEKDLTLKLGTFGDLKRSIGPGKINSIYASYTRQWNWSKKVQFYGEYISESLDTSRGESTTIGIIWNTYF